MKNDIIGKTDNQLKSADVNLDHIDSPCIGSCTLNHLQICNGCFRSLGEIASWSAANTEQRRRILDNIANRQQI
ncbi:MAG: DUF1289 domain-containing protein [Methylococcales bacterium]